MNKSKEPSPWDAPSTKVRPQTSGEEPTRGSKFLRGFLLGAGLLTAVLYAAVTWLSFFCEQSDPQQERPLLTVLILFSVAGVVYLTACFTMIFLRRGSDGHSSASALYMMIGWAVVFRLILLFSIPIQEVDLYRYIWDGVVTSQGISPYKYSPQEVQDIAVARVQHGPNVQLTYRYRSKAVEQDQVSALAKLASGEDLEKVFELVHFEQYTTPYPPTNQPFFALAAVMGQTIGSFYGYLYSMKGVLILFDLGTGLVLVSLLGRLDLPKIWSVAWFWCPLVMKEIANSGHLDSIAVFFTTLAIWTLVSAAWPRVSDRRPSALWGCCAFVFLALGVAAKIYPLVLFPLFAIVAAKRFKFFALIPVGMFPVLVAVLLWPIISHLDSVKKLEQEITGSAARKVLAPPPGIEAFARHWEMNDFLFMMVVENLKPYGNKPEDFDEAAGDQPSLIWFVKTSNEFRHQTAEAVAKAVPGIKKHEAAFWLTRRTTLCIFALVGLFCCVRLTISNDPRLFLEMVFLAIAWFWLLAPTQNPWYWTWALPMICFCRNPVWYLFAFTSLAYYLRFYCEYHFTDGVGKFGTPYAGTALFDFTVPVLEFAPLLLLLVLMMVVRVGMRFVRSARADVEPQVS